jgi:hypothetical protein
MDAIWAFYLLCAAISLFVVIFIVPAARELRKNKGKK